MRKSSSLIKEKQKRLNITYDELARKINIPVPTLLSWANDNSKPTKEQLQAILDLPVSNTQSYKEFGNSVAVPVINAIADNITKFLDENYKQ